MNTVTKALIIADPWIDLILSGQKDWEMRSTGASLRGWFGLIRKGSGTVVGVARLDGVDAALSNDEMVASYARHRIPEDMIRSGQVDKWRIPWILGDIRPLAHPVPYKHPYGAVTWVDLQPDVTAAIAAALAGGLSAMEAKAAQPEAPRAEVSVKTLATVTAAAQPPVLPASRVSGESRWLGDTEITAGNIKNNHFYLRSFLARFPSDLVGGSNKSETAARNALVEWGGGSPVETDIDGQKQFFRARSWIGQFFARNDAEPGDVVRVEETAPYRYKVSLIKRKSI